MIPPAHQNLAYLLDRRPDVAGVGTASEAANLGVMSA